MESKTIVINIRLTADEVAAVDREAVKEERKRAPMIVRLVREAIRKRLEEADVTQARTAARAAKSGRV